MVVKVKRLRQRPGLVSISNADIGLTARSDTVKSDSLSSFQKKDGDEKNRKSCRVCFAADYQTPDVVHPAPDELSDSEKKLAYYTAEDMKKFDKDRALTVLVYQTRKNNNGAAWDDNVDSLRGLEEITNHKKFEKTRRQKLIDHRKAVLSEQERLNSDEGQQELASAAKAIKKPATTLYHELLRGTSCSLSKIDKQRAASLGYKDEKASLNYCRGGGGGGSSRKLLKKVKSKLSVWTNMSNKSLLAGYSSGEDDTAY